MTEAQAQAPVQLAVFRLGSEEYAIDIMQIREIIYPLKITRVPKAPPFIEGVIELRGAIVPILDLRKRFELPAPPPVRSNRYILTTLQGRTVGLVVDAVREVLRLPEAEIKPPPDLGAAPGVASPFLGTCHVADRIILILDLGSILSHTEKSQLGAPAHAPKAAPEPEVHS